MADVTVIPATRSLHKHTRPSENNRRKVAAYARVSTNSIEQLTSYEAQVDYYTKYIQNNPAWDFVGIYTDEGISATNTKKREGFNRMINDALCGKIDLIVTKSVSRFARNTVDSLSTVRKLKDRGVEVFFEKENIYTFDGSGEVMITILSSMAQEESRNISENVTWGHRKRFEDGKIMLAYARFLGYKRGKDGLPEIVPEQAEIVRSIYRRFIDGDSAMKIAHDLTAEGIPTPGGKSKWQSSTVTSILTNEKYKGDALLQKSFTVDFLTKKTKKNEGEIPQYYVENSHPAIVSPEEWQFVQNEMIRRKDYKGSYRSIEPLSSHVVCGDCGSYYGSKVWHSTDKYRKVIWQCNCKFEHHCKTPSLNETEIKDGFVDAINQLIDIREYAIEDTRKMLMIVGDTSKLDNQITERCQEMDVVAELTRRCIKKNSTAVQDQEKFTQEYNALVKRYETAKKKVDELTQERNKLRARVDGISGFIFRLSELNVQEEYNRDLWLSMLEYVTIQRNGTKVYKFLNGSEIAV